MTTSLAYLFQKRIIEVEGKNETIYECVDVVYGACYRNRENEATFHIFTGTYVNSYAHILEKNCTECLEFIVELKSLDEALLENNKMMNFLQIKKNMLQENATYFKYTDGKLLSLNDEFIEKYIVNSSLKDENEGKILTFPKKTLF